MAAEQDDVDAMVEPVVPSRHRWLAGLLDAGPGDLVADLGCGTGGTLAQVVRALADGGAVGVDASRAALARTAETLASDRARLLLVQADLKDRLPFADAFYLAFYPLLAAGLLLLVRGRAPGRDWASLIDATIITTGLGMLSWVYLIGPNVRAPGLALPQRLVSIAYPLGDVLLLAVAVRLWRTGGHAAFASRLLAIGLVALLIGDTVYGLSLINGDWQVGGPVDAIWYVYYVAFGLAALHPSMVSLSSPTTVSPRLTWSRLVLLAGASLMAPAVLVVQAVRGEPIDVAVIAGGSVVLFLLTLARMGGLASEVALQAERKRAMQRVLRATEQERIRLAADLHDGPVQELTALRYGLTRARNRVQRGEPAEAEALLASIEDDLAAGVTGLRRLMSELRPAVLDEQGLEAALQNQAQAFEAASGVSCTIRTGLEGQRLAPELETVLFRVTQESLNSVGKHARASNVTVSLAADDGAVRLRIRDDGVGFDPLAARRLAGEGHFGLAGMRERVEMVGGRLVVDSAPGRGTTVNVEMAPRAVPV
jgi:signal transduction histidine kinase